MLSPPIRLNKKEGGKLRRNVLTTDVSAQGEGFAVRKKGRQRKVERKKKGFLA